MREKDQTLTKKIEDAEQRHRVELQKIIEKYANDKLNILQRESEQSGAKESERLKEIKDLYEGKIKEKDNEVTRLREYNSRLESQLQELKNESGTQQNQMATINKDLEKELTMLKESKTEIGKRLEKKEEKIKTLK